MKNTKKPMRETDLSQKLSDHFALREFVVSGAAIRHNIDNTPETWHVERLRSLCRIVLEPLRRRFGVIRITSGYRCPRLNAIVGGAAASQHLKGEAADIHVSGKAQGEKMFAYIRDNLDFDQLLFERRAKSGAYWLHVSCKPGAEGNRHDCQHIEVSA